MIPDEAVEAAMIAWLDRSKAPGSWSLEEEVRAALDAAAPHLMRTAWDEGWEAHGDWGGPTPNPYRVTK